MGMFQIGPVRVNYGGAAFEQGWDRLVRCCVVDSPRVMFCVVL